MQLLRPARASGEDVLGQGRAKPAHGQPKVAEPASVAALVLLVCLEIATIQAGNSALPEKYLDPSPAKQIASP